MATTCGGTGPSGARASTARAVKPHYAATACPTCTTAQCRKIGQTAFGDETQDDAPARRPSIWEIGKGSSISPYIAFVAMSAATAAVVQHLGFGACLDCFTLKQPGSVASPGLWHVQPVRKHARLSRPPPPRVPRGRNCASYRHVQNSGGTARPKASAKARAVATCKIAAAQRDPKQVQKRAQTPLELTNQF